jgi:hypothetical protein
MPNRNWRQGMHQAIEAKEEIEIADATETIARLSSPGSAISLFSASTTSFQV